MSKVAEMNRQVQNVIANYNMSDQAQLQEMMFVLTTANSNLQIKMAELLDRQRVLPAPPENGKRSAPVVEDNGNGA